jgi:hypothetical protein
MMWLEIDKVPIELAARSPVAIHGRMPVDFSAFKRWALQIVDFADF